MFNNTRNRKSGNYILAALGIGLLLNIATPIPSYAFFGGVAAETDPASSSKHRETRKVITDSINANIDEMERTIVEAIEGHGGQISGNLKEQIAADANIQQTVDERARQREIERQRFDAMKNSETAPSTCKMLTRAMTSTIYGSGVAAERYLQTANTTDKVVSIFLGTPSGTSGSPVTSAGGPVSAKNIINHFGTRYCSPELAIAGGCDAGSQVDPKFQNAHINASKALFSTDNLDDESSKNACHDFTLANAGRADGAIDQGFIDRTVNSPEAYIDRTAASNRLSLSNSIMSSYCARRTAIESSGGSNDDVSVYKKMIAETPAFADLRGKDLSQNSAYRVMSQSFIYNPEVIGQQEEALTEKQVLIELYYVLAWMSNQNYELYQLLDKQSVVDAAQLQVLNEMLFMQRQAE